MWRSDSPTAASALSGEVAVTFTVTPDVANAISPTSAYVETRVRESLPSTRTKLRRQYISVTDCPAEQACIRSAVVNTRDLLQGPNQVRVVVFGSGNRMAFDSVAVTVDNPLPSVEVTSLTPGPVWGRAVPLQAAVTQSSRPDSAPVARVLFYAGGVLLGADSTAPYEIFWDTTAGRAGPATVQAVAVDDLGNVAVSGTVRTVVNPGPAVAIEGPSADQLLPRTGNTIQWSASVHAPLNSTYSPSPSYWLETVEVLVDDEVIEETRRADWWCGYVDCGTYRRMTTLQFSTGWAATPGEHTVTVRATDSSGAQSSSSVRVYVDGGARISPVRRHDGTVFEEGAQVAAGTVLRLSADYAPVVPQARTYQHSMTIDGTMVHQETGCIEPWETLDRCPATATIDGYWRVPADAMGEHILRVGARTTGSGADETVISQRFTVYPAASLVPTVSTSSTRPGGRISVSARLLRTDTGAGVANRPVAIQWRTAGSSKWTTVATRTTGARGVVSAVLKPPSNGHYRMVHADRPGSLGPATGASIPVKVRAAVTITLSAGSVPRGGAVAVTSRVAPAERNVDMTLQRRSGGGAWRTVKTVRASAAGVAKFSLRATRGTHTLRVVKAKTARFDAVASPSSRLHVR